MATLQPYDHDIPDGHAFAETRSLCLTDMLSAEAPVSDRAAAEVGSGVVGTRRRGVH